MVNEQLQLVRMYELLIVENMNLWCVSLSHVSPFFSVEDACILGHAQHDSFKMASEELCLVRRAQILQCLGFNICWIPVCVISCVSVAQYSLHFFRRVFLETSHSRAPISCLLLFLVSGIEAQSQPPKCCRTSTSRIRDRVRHRHWLPQPITNSRGPWASPLFMTFNSRRKTPWVVLSLLILS